MITNRDTQGLLLRSRGKLFFKKSIANTTCFMYRGGFVFFIDLLQLNASNCLSIIKAIILVCNAQALL